MDPRTLVIGEALIDIVESTHTQELVGGSPANVAVGVARQGHAVELLTRIGRDERGARIAEHIASAGAALTTSSWGAAATSTARARLRADGSAEYDFDIDWQVSAPDLDGVALVHSGSIALFLEPGGDTVLDILERAHNGAVVTVDPNIRPALVGTHTDAFARFARAAASADLVKLSDEDAAWLYPGLVPEQVLAEIAVFGPRVVVMTRGGAGALALGPGGIAEVAALEVTVADTIGAGDAYMASLISSTLDDPALLEDQAALERALRRAAVMAGITVSRAGANPPTRREVDAVL
jgi:fructokinase